MNIALVIAGGSGTRMGQDVPKQFLIVKDKLYIGWLPASSAGRCYRRGVH